MKLFHNSTNAKNPIILNNFQECRWQNCCVLKLDLVPNHASINYDFTLSLLYPGEIEQNEKKEYHYWSNITSTHILNISAGASRKYHKFQEINGSINLSDLRNDMRSEVDNIQSSCAFTFYLMRHGQAKHNIMEGWSKIWRPTDTSLTNEGVTMAKLAGEAINTDLRLSVSKLDYCYVSDLIRTRETFAGAVIGMSSDCLPLTNDATKLKLIVLPCAHELAFNKTGNCDSKQKFSQIFAKENKIGCKKDHLDENPEKCRSFNVNIICPSTFSSESSTSSGIVCKSINVEIDWYTLYYNFYGDSDRATQIPERRHCRNTSMIEESINHIININRVGSAGGDLYSKRRFSKRKMNYNKIHKYSKRYLRR
jgi:hypothetical protein